MVATAIERVPLPGERRNLIPPNKTHVFCLDWSTINRDHLTNLFPDISFQFAESSQDALSRFESHPHIEAVVINWNSFWSISETKNAFGLLLKVGARERRNNELIPITIQTAVPAELTPYLKWFLDRNASKWPSEITVLDKRTIDSEQAEIFEVIHANA